MAVVVARLLLRALAVAALAWAAGIHAEGDLPLRPPPARRAAGGARLAAPTPVDTDADVLLRKGTSPRPTTAPSRHGFHKPDYVVELLRRTWAPVTCGYRMEIGSYCA